MAAQMLSIDELIQQTKDLPSMPESALKVVRQSNDPRSTSEEIAKTLANDQALSARVLRLSNSAYYGLPRQISTLNDAVRVLGMRTIRHIALLASTFPWLSKSIPGYDLAPKALWRHSISVGLCAQALARRSKAANPEEAFAIGLLHDIGKLVMSVWMEEELAQMVRDTQERSLSFDQAEMERFGFTHAEVGGHLAAQWNLPESIVEAIKFHHSPDEYIGASGLVEITHLADAICLSLGVGVGGDGLCYAMSRAALRKLDMTEIDLEYTADELIETIAKAQPLFEIAQS